jgi:anti-sigma regulatory factor (Ser/Thr protein kinase)
MGEAPGTPDPGGWTDQAWFAMSWADGPASLDLRIDSGSLHSLRARVRACAAAGGLPADQVEDVVLAMHEVASNVVRHGDGTGRLRLWALPASLRFQVDDGDHPPLEAAGWTDGQAGADGRSKAGALPFIPGHGLWVVQQICSRMIARSGPGGTSVAVEFDQSGA